ncbi:helicase HerA-like domain-containing protein [Aeromonas rivipollensis]|uniref:helicase HerA-like domain-containing protein n=1 Tax=Aeromonas rivipollensis TaxID=948519 RepID=UPI0027D95373|nr:helicase HerA-like domain-containing protein [uncultured Aeromonas sp.]MDU1142526.1 helicase HerA-like domain-containing protein [Aeromonas hydrophila]
MAQPLTLAYANGQPISLLPAMANRHGLITGATGTGKTVTLQVLAEGFSRLGVPVFLADVKGDLSGLGAAGTPSSKLDARLAQLGIPAPAFAPSPTLFWDLFAEQGHPVRATVSDMGPLLLARLLGLNDTQSGVLELVFKVADDEGLLLLDLKDLRAMVQFAGDNAKSLTTRYGNVSTASIGAILRNLLTLESAGGDHFFGEPMLDIQDLLQTDGAGQGHINVLAAGKLTQSSRLYACFLLWLLSELFEQLPEVGDPDKPVLVFFFDEAHLLFNDAPRALLEKIELVVRLIRSKGVGVYFVTQSPADIPDSVLGQLGNRVQHALRAFTPSDQKAVRIAANTLRANPAFDAAGVITELGVGEALVSLLDEKGRPSVVERAFIAPPASRIGPLSDAERQALIRGSVLHGRYETREDRESAFERLNGGAPAASDDAPQTPSEQGGGLLDALNGILFGRTGPRGGQHDGVVQTAAKSVARTLGNEVGRHLVRGVLGSLLGGSKRRR